MCFGQKENDPRWKCEFCTNKSETSRITKHSKKRNGISTSKLWELNDRKFIQRKAGKWKRKKNRTDGYGTRADQAQDKTTDLNPTMLITVLRRGRHKIL